MNDLKYYKLPFPKSTGFEWFEEQVKPIVDKSPCDLESKLNTSVHHIAYQISKQILKYAEGRDSLLITGGGTRNTFLIEQIRFYLGTDVEVVIPDPDIIDYKEAIVFAFMGVLRARDEVRRTACI